MNTGTCGTRRWGSLIGLGMLMAVLLPALGHADSYGVAPYQEFNQRIKAAQSVSALSDGVFGDAVSLYTGATQFKVTDVSLPGNNVLPVQVGRRLVVQDRTRQLAMQVSNLPYTPANLGGFADWDLDVPWIEGMFVAEDGWTVATTGNPNDRCSNVAVPNTYTSMTGGSVWLADVWHGNQMHIPGAGSQTLLVNNQAKSPAYASRSTYPWVTQGNFRIGCVASIDDGAGQGFVAVSPSGVTYTFNHMIVRTAPNLKLPWKGSNAPDGYLYIPRSHIYLVATEVQDRFGNWVKYAWSGGHLTGITSSDGRSITLNWSGNNISTVTSAAGTWTYHYGTASGADANGAQYSWPYLTSVTRPDGSTWRYSYAGGMFLTPASSDDLVPDQYGCQARIAPEPSGSFGYTIGAPSGASATFQFIYAMHRRSLVPRACTKSSDPEAPSNSNYPTVYNFFENFTIVSKTISGPGLPGGMTWSYNYTAFQATNPGYATATQPWNYDDTTQPYIPPVTCNGCASSADLVVTGPTSITRYTFGVDYARNEGQLLKKQIEDLSKNVLKTTTYTYVSDAQAASEPFADVAGQQLLPNYTSPMGNRNRPVVKTVVSQDGATFTTAINSFDTFARATSETESSSLGYSKTGTTAYHDDLTRWVLGQVSSSSVLSTAVPCTANTASNTGLTSCTIYNTLDQPTSTYAFGKLVSTKAWNGDGTLHTVTDGDGNVTTLSSWKRGLPQTVQYADGSSESAVVNDAGWITALTDENGFTTDYAYDSMGRLSKITYPQGDDVNWSQTSISFAPVGSEYGIPTGHWKQIISTGNDRTVTEFDALWRPLITEHVDASENPATLSQVVTRYDAGGRKIFTSYPTNVVSNYTASVPGVHTSYDALNRVTVVNQDSSLGQLPTTTQYLSGFETEVTDPRAYSTFTRYQAFGTPTTQSPVWISAPQGELTTIQRDVFGKPLSITRTGTASGSPSLTHAYVYDAHQQLCKRIDPESGATAFGYDGAGNLSWSASGLDLPDTGSCDTSTAEASGRVVMRTYGPRNRLATISYPDSSSDASFGYYPDGALKTQTVSNGGNPVTTSYDYDKRRLLTQETLSIANTSPLTLAYDYDANGHLSSMTYPDGRTVAYTPNALGQPTQAGSYATGVTYYPNGSVKGFTYGNGAVHTMTETTRGLVGRSADVYGSTTFHDDTYAYDGDGNVAAITTPDNVDNVTMTYDSLDRLTAADSPTFGGSGEASYKYGVLDNLLSASVGNHTNQAYSYNANDQLMALVEPGTHYVLHHYTYDPQGNLAGKDNQAYQFDQANRLRNVPGVASYLYDAAGRRVQKDETLYGGILMDFDYSRGGQLMYRWQPSLQNATDYIYLGGTLIAQVASNASGAGSPAVPAAPASISVTPATDTTGAFSVSWAVSSGATSYVLWQNANQGGADSVYSGADTSTSITGLASGHYVYEVQACNASGCSSSTASSAVTVIPAASGSISVPANAFTASVPVSWQASSLANNYVLEEYPYNGGWGVAYNGVDTSDTVTVPGSGVYQFQVAACGAGGCSANTTSSDVTVTLPPSLSASTTASISGTFSLNWNAVSTATGYNLFQNGTSVYSGSGIAWTSSDLGNGSYAYTVQSCNAMGCGGPSNAVTVAVNHIPAPSLTASATTSTSGTFSLSWNTVAGATSYQLYQSGKSSPVYSGSGTSWGASALANGSYTYTVYGCNGSTCGFASNAVKVTVLHIPPAPHLTSSTTTSTTGSFTLSWTAATGAASYQLKQHLGGAVTMPYNAGGTAWSSNALGNGSYTYQVFACNASGCSGGSNSVGVSVVPAAPATVGAPVLAHVGIVFDVNWSAVARATSYQARQTNTATGATGLIYSGGTATSAPVQPTATGTFQYAARACDGSICSAWTEESHTTTVEASRGGIPETVPASGSSSP